MAKNVFKEYERIIGRDIREQVAELRLRRNLEKEERGAEMMATVEKLNNKKMQERMDAEIAEAEERQRLRDDKAIAEAKEKAKQKLQDKFEEARRKDEMARKEKGLEMRSQDHKTPKR